MDSPPFPSAAMLSPAAVAPPPFQVVPYGVEISNRVFVGGCPYNMTELEMTQFFNQFGEVKDVKIITDRDGGKSRGYGFVTFATEEEAARVYSKGSIYYEQKKLNVAKAIRKYGGQYQKANQEYVNGQRLVWLHPNGYLMTQQEEGWQMEQLLSHTQPVKPCYSYYPPGPANPLNPGPSYPPMPANPYFQSSHPHPTFYGNTYNYQPPYTSSFEEQTISVISTVTNSGHASLESSDSSNLAPPFLGAEERNDFDVTALEVKTKQLSLDSAYTSEADLDTTSTATNSGTTSPQQRHKSYDMSPQQSKAATNTATIETLTA